MRSISEKIAFLQGLAQGKQLDTQSAEGELIAKMIEILGDIASELNDLSEGQNDLSEYIESVDGDLEDLEQRFDDENDYDFDEDDDEYDFDDDEDDFDDDTIYLECACPSCKGNFYVQADEVDEDALHICPMCGERVHVETVEAEDIPIAQLVEDDGDDEE